MDLQLASFGDLDKISTIENETNKYPWSLNNFKSSLEAGNSSIVLKDKKNILGYAFFSVIGTDSHLLNITVSKNYQGRGYGKLFYNDLHHFSKGRVLNLACEVNTRPMNLQSIKFHDKFGFYEVGTQETENGKKKVSLLMFDTKSG